MLVADVGQLYISNSIKSSSQYGLIDTMDVSLSSFQVSGYAQPSYVISTVFAYAKFPSPLHGSCMKEIERASHNIFT